MTTTCCLRIYYNFLRRIIQSLCERRQALFTEHHQNQLPPTDHVKAQDALFLLPWGRFFPDSAPCLSLTEDPRNYSGGGPVLSNLEGHYLNELQQ